MAHVSVPAEIVAELHGVLDDGAEPAEEDEALGGFADVAAYSAVFAAQAATAVTLLQGPETLRTVVAALARRRHRKQAYWLNLKGPGGMANLELIEPLDEVVLAGLLVAIWRFD